MGGPHALIQESSDVLCESPYPPSPSDGSAGTGCYLDQSAYVPGSQVKVAWANLTLGCPDVGCFLVQPLQSFSCSFNIVFPHVIY